MVRTWKYNPETEDWDIPIDRPPGDHELLGEIQKARERLIGANLAVTQQEDLIRSQRPDMREKPEAQLATMTEARQAELDRARGKLDVFIGPLTKDLEKNTSQRRALLEESERAWRREFGASLPGDLEEAKANIRRLDNVQQFAKLYENSGTTMQRAYQVAGDQILKERFQGAPGLGGIIAHLDKERAGFFESDESKALSEQLGPLVDATKELNAFAHEVKRAREGLGGIAGSSNDPIYGQIEGLHSQAYEALNGQSGQGGGYMGGAAKKWTIQAEGSFMEPA